MNFLIGLLVGFISIPIIYGIFIWFLMRLQKHSSKLLQIIGELFIFGIICILVVTLTIVIIKPYA